MPFNQGKGSLVYRALYTPTLPTSPYLVNIQGGTVVNHDHRLVADVLVEGELISAVGLSLEVCFKLTGHCFTRACRMLFV